MKFKADIVTYIIGAVIALTSLAISSILDDGHFRYIVVVTFPIVTLLIADRVSHLLSGRYTASEIDKLISSSFPRSHLIYEFPNSQRAMEYLISRLGECQTLHNTRLSPLEVEDAHLGNRHTTDRFDELVAERIAQGMDYLVVTSADHVPALNAIAKSVARKSRNPASVGTYVAYTIEQPTTPMLQFAILNYGDDREVLFGWAIASEDDFSSRVFRFRDIRVCSYFEMLFNSMKSSGNKITLERPSARSQA